MTILSINPYGYLVAIIIAAGVIMFYLLKRGLVERPHNEDGGIRDILDLSLRHHHPQVKPEPVKNLITQKVKFLPIGLSVRSLPETTIFTTNVELFIKDELMGYNDFGDADMIVVTGKHGNAQDGWKYLLSKPFRHDIGWYVTKRMYHTD